MAIPVTTRDSTRDGGVGGESLRSAVSREFIEASEAQLKTLWNGGKRTGDLMSTSTASSSMSATRIVALSVEPQGKQYLLAEYARALPRTPR